VTPASLTIAGREIGPGRPCYLIAEMSANHHQDFDTALAILHAAKEAGVDAVKLQTYTPETITLDAEQPHFQIGPGTIWSGRSLRDLYAEAFMPWEWQPKLIAAAKELGLTCFSSPFDHGAVDFLESLEVPAYKIASFELVDLPLIRRAARTGKPLIMSTGMASETEIAEALETARGAGAREIALLKCTSAYPASPADANLRTLADMQTRFNVPVGLSDHTLGLAVPIAAVALGACIIEKHLTLSRNTPGPDGPFSLEPHEFKQLVEAVRVAEQAIGRVCYEPTEKEAASRAFRRSLFVVEDVRAGEPFTERNVRSIRPAAGLHTRQLDDVLGKLAACDLPRGTPLAWEHVAPS
jgi:pseudaminic acid synthase